MQTTSNDIGEHPRTTLFDVHLFLSTGFSSLSHSMIATGMRQGANISTSSLFYRRDILLSASFQPHHVPSAPHHLDSLGWLAYLDVCPVRIFLSLLTSSATCMQYAQPFCVGKPTTFISGCSCQYANRNGRVLRCFAFGTFCFCTHHCHAIRNSQFFTFFREACTSIEPRIVEKCLKRNQRRFSLCPPPYFSQGLVTFARTTQFRALRHNHHPRDIVPFVCHFQPSLNSEQQWVRWTASHISGLRISASHSSSIDVTGLNQIKKLNNWCK